MYQFHKNLEFKYESVFTKVTDFETSNGSCLYIGFEIGSFNYHYSGGMAFDPDEYLEYKTKLDELVTDHPELKLDLFTPTYAIITDSKK